MKIVRFLIALVIVGSGTLLAVLYFNIMPPSKSEEKIIIEIEAGGFSRAIQKLESEGVISNRRAFVLFSKFFGYESKIKVGEYEIQKNMWPHEILSVFSSGKSIQRTFTIAEGLNKFDISVILESKGICDKDDFFRIIHDSNYIQKMVGHKAISLEGYLFPETYSYTKNMKCSVVVEAMVKRSLEVISEFFKEGTPKEVIYKMLTLSSIIEKETGAPEERPTISSVFHNRMKIRMKLQTDPTVIYGIAIQTGAMPKNIRKKDLLSSTPYNTYTIYGLPPGPIANPGKESIRAALQPAATDYLYFVSMNEGRHYFSKTLQEHNEAVRKYQVNRAARTGKSWRNLKNSNPKAQ